MEIDFNKYRNEEVDLTNLELPTTEERLTDCITILSKQKKDLQDRIDKVINLLERSCIDRIDAAIYTFEGKFIEYDLEDIIDILEGKSDKEWKI